jgi:purine nucleosidase/pyrimidine-specific ribonucleoside hydrolase
MPTQLLLDTDIGDDIDDAMALALICSSPELQLVGVTCVLGNVAARSRQARSMLTLAGEPYRSVPVAAGCSALLTSRPHPDKPWFRTQLDPDHTPNQDVICLPDAQLPPPDLRHGVDFMIQTLLEGDGSIVPVLIGPLTNFAMAIVKEPRLKRVIPRAVLMAGEFREHLAEYNVRVDPEAAAIVCASGIPLEFIPWYAGVRIARFTPRDIESLADGKGRLSRCVHDTIRAWQAFHRHGDTTVPLDTHLPSLFDPMAVATVIDESLFEWRRGRVSIDLNDGPGYGYTHFDPDPAGPHRVAWDGDRARCINFFLDRVRG